MVWGLIPIGSLPGAQTYYIFAKGIYKVGRKDCDVIIQTDRAISRLHAEIIVDNMSLDSSDNGSSDRKIRIRDHSKFGTFINKEQGSKAVHSNPKKEGNLKDGDVVSFGTGNASFRFCFVGLVICIGSLNNLQADNHLQATLTSIGARTTPNWSMECTHMLAEESSPVNADLIDAVIAQKPVVHATWFKYKFGSKLASLIRLVGADVLHVDELLSNSQTSGYGGKNQLVLVNPTTSIPEFNRSNQISSLSKVIEAELIAAVLSGHLESSKLEPPSILVSSSHSTDETIVADSDMEVDTAASIHISPSVKLENAIKKETNDNLNHEVSEEMHGGDAEDSQKLKFLSSRVSDSGGLLQRKHEDNDLGASEHQNTDIIYSQDLVVRNVTVPAATRSRSEESVVNFKCFRKTATLSGNSFNTIIPFSKDPYNESDYQNNGLTAYMREEKRRKQMEAIAEDLFNNAKAKKRGSANNSIRAFFTRT